MAIAMQEETGTGSICGLFLHINEIVEFTLVFRSDQICFHLTPRSRADSIFWQFGNVRSFAGKNFLVNISVAKVVTRKKLLIGTSMDVILLEDLAKHEFQSPGDSMRKALLVFFVVLKFNRISLQDGEMEILDMIDWQKMSLNSLENQNQLRFLTFSTNQDSFAKYKSLENVAAGN